MATTKDVDRTPSGRIKYRGESFAGFNKPKRTPGKSKKFAVLAKKGNEIKMVRYGDPNMEIKKDSPARRKNFRARHNWIPQKTSLPRDIGRAKIGKEQKMMMMGRYKKVMSMDMKEMPIKKKKKTKRKAKNTKKGTIVGKFSSQEV